MNALEAYRLAKDRWRNLTHVERNQYENILASIRGAIEKKECYSIFWYQAISDAVEKKLEDSGYSIKNMSDRDGLLIEISWRSAAIENSSKQE